MFERFTPDARRTVVLAQEEARARGHDHIGTEHLLLGLARLADSTTVRILTGLGTDVDAVRRRLLPG